MIVFCMRNCFVREDRNLVADAEPDWHPVTGFSCSGLAHMVSAFITRRIISDIFSVTPYSMALRWSIQESAVNHTVSHHICRDTSEETSKVTAGREDDKLQAFTTSLTRFSSDMAHCLSVSDVTPKKSYVCRQFELRIAARGQTIIDDGSVSNLDGSRRRQCRNFVRVDCVRLAGQHYVSV